MIKKILFEPLVHFLLIGAILYIYFDLSSEKSVQTKKQQITLLEYDLGKLSKQTHLDDPVLLFDYLKYQKTLLTDAYSLELYKDDKTIQAILFNKMEFILRSNAKLKEPSEDELEKYYKQNLVDFSKLLSFDLYVKVFNDKIDKKLLEKLTIISNMKGTKDIQFFQKTHLDEITQKFGKYFALQTLWVPHNSWSKPFTFNNKTYILYVTKKIVGEAYSFQSIENRVYQHYRYTKIRQKMKKAYEDLLKNYVFKVEK